jgi:PAS domain S-box-containing protein
MDHQRKENIDYTAHDINVQNLIDSTDIGAIFLDRDLRIKLFSRRACDLFSLTPADLGRRISDVAGPLIPEKFVEELQMVLARAATIEREVEAPDARWFLIRIHPYLTAEDRIDGVVVTSLDFTRRRRAEDALRRNEEHLRSVVDGVTEYAIVTTDLEGIIQTWNLGAERMFGHQSQQAIGKHVSLIYTPEDNAADVPKKEMAKAIETGRAPDERWHIRKDGSRFYVSGVLTPLGEPLGGFVKIARDLTHTKAVEEELTQSREHLEETVADRTRELAQTNEALRAEIAQRIQTEKMRVRLLGRIVAAQEDERRRIARDIHDHLGQQTTAVRLKLEALKEFCRDNQEGHAFIEEVQKLAEKLDYSVDFLAWELRPAGLEDLGLSAALGNYIKEWSAFNAIEADFHTSGLKDERLAPSVEVNLYRIAQEALNNAIKHAKATRVDVLLERREQQVVLIVEDNGVGFDVDKQLNDYSGMGLIGMKERAAIANGTLEIQSTPLEGTTIFVRTPLHFG